jgi:putative inorganic carbon (HCO3(-)) transporter
MRSRTPLFAPAFAGLFLAGVVTAILPVALGSAVAVAPAPALAATILLPVAVAMFLRPDLLLLVLIAGVPWESKLAYPSATTTLLALIRVVLPVLFVAWALIRRERLILPRFLAPLGVLILLIMLSLMVSPDPGEGITKTLRYLIFGVSFFVAIQFLGNRAVVLRAVRVLTISASAAALYALVGFLSGKLTRAAGPIADPNGFAYLIVTVIPLAVFLFVEDRSWRLLWASSVTILFAATLGSLSRGALVGLGALVVWGILTRRISAVALLGAASVVATIVVVAVAFFGTVLSQRIAGREQVSGQSAAARTVFWEAGARMSLSHPLVGVGPERYDAEREKFLRSSPVALVHQVSAQSQQQTIVLGVHNSYLEVAAEDGLPAALAFCLFLFAIWRSLSRFVSAPSSRDDYQGRRLAAALQGALITAVFSGFFLSGQLEPPFWLVGVLAGALTATTVAAARPTASSRSGAATRSWTASTAIPHRSGSPSSAPGLS